MKMGQKRANTQGARTCTSMQHFQPHVASVTFFALQSRPSLHANLGAARVTVKVTEKVIPGSAEFVAKGAEVVGVAAEAEAVLQAQGAAVVAEGLPLFPRVQHGGEEHSLNQLT